MKAEKIPDTKKKILTLYFPPETGASLHTIVSSIDSS
jgi:hypothetical protein